MILSNLTLTSFRCYDGIELPLDAPRIYIAAQNGVGKTSLKEVVRWVLTGKAQGLDARGAGVEKLIPVWNGHKAVSAAVTIPSIGTVERTWSATGSSLRVQGWTGTTQSQQQALYDKLETAEPFLQAVFDSRTFLALQHADAKALVLSVLNVRIKIGDGDDAPVYTLSELDDLYDQAFEDRKAAKVRLKATPVPAKPIPQEFPAKEAVVSRLEELREERDDLQVAIGSVGTERQQLKAELERIAGLTDPERPPFDEQIMDLEERLAIMDESLKDAIDVALSPLAVLRSRTEALRAHKPTQGCVIDPDVPCKTPKVNFTNRAKEIEAHFPVEAAPETAPPGTSHRKTLQQELSQLQRKRADFDAKIEQHVTRRAEGPVLTAKLEALPDVEAQQTALAEKKTRIQTGEGVLARLIASEKATQAYETALEQRQALEADVNRLEALCEVLGPSGVRVQALGTRLEEFTKVINSVLLPWGWTVGFTLDPWQVRVNDRPVDTYSRSEQYRIGVAIQVAVALLSGLNFLIVDELDMLDSGNRDVLMRLLYPLVKDATNPGAPLDQVIILGTREPAQPLPVVRNLLAYRLSGGGSVTPAERTVVTERVQG